MIIHQKMTDGDSPARGYRCDFGSDFCLRYLAVGTGAFAVFKGSTATSMLFLMMKSSCFLTFVIEPYPLTVSRIRQN